MKGFTIKRTVGFLNGFVSEQRTVHGSEIIIYNTAKHTSVQTLSPVGQGSPHAGDELLLLLLQASTDDRKNSRSLDD